MYQLKWEAYYQNETTPEPSIEQIISLYEQDNPSVFAFDTETTGLNIVKDKPFLFILAWKARAINLGRVFVLDYEPNKIKRLLELMKTAKYIVGFNTKYDLHMLRNGGSPFPFEILNDNCELTDVRILNRLVMYADATKVEQKMNLKGSATKYIDENAHNYEFQVKDILNVLNKKNQSILKTMLKPLKFSMKALKDTLKDATEGIDALPYEVREVYEQWLEDYGDATYYDVYKQSPNTMRSYAFYDGIFTLELFLYFLNQYEKLNNEVNNTLQTIFHEENYLIRCYYKQEEIGFKVDIDYLLECRPKLIEFSKTLETQLHSLLGEPINASQNDKLLDIFINKFKVDKSLFFNEKETKKKVKKEFNTNKPTPEQLEQCAKYSFNKAAISRLLKLDGIVAELAKLISKLRSVNKWLSTYVVGIYKEVRKNGDGKFHPVSDQVGTVSGRITGNMQQFPKDPLVDFDGNVLFIPRKIMIPSGDDYQFLILQDFDQMELRVQAHYTVQFKCPDQNLCKIFVPYGCVNKLTGEVYDFDKHRNQWDLKDENGDSIWIDGTTNKPWVPIDPHGMHVETAFGYTKDHPDFKHLRSAAKIINFASNYGCSLEGLLSNENLEEYPQDMIAKIYNAYKTNFKGVGTYQSIVNNTIESFLKIQNVYGRVYKMRSSAGSYKCANYLVQGSCADLVKQCLIKIDKFLNENNLKSRVLYTIHDEIIWELHKDEGWIIQHIEHILNDTADWCKIPLTCGTDATYTNWAEKKDISNFVKGGETNE